MLRNFHEISEKVQKSLIRERKVVFQSSLHFILTMQGGFSYAESDGPLTQEVEYLPFKQRVVGSSPARPTILRHIAN